MFTTPKGVTKAPRYHSNVRYDFNLDPKGKRRSTLLQEAIQSRKAMEKLVKACNADDESLAAYRDAVRREMQAERLAGHVSEEQRQEWVQLARLLIKLPEKRYALVGHINRPMGTIYSPPPKDEIRPNPTGETVRIVAFKPGLGSIDCPVYGSYYWCCYVLENDKPRWVDVPLANYLNPDNWRAPACKPK